MFKRLTRAWNARTPDYLHPHTKENIIWQLKLTAVLFVGMTAYDWWKYHQERKQRKQWALESE